MIKIEVKTKYIKVSNEWFCKSKDTKANKLIDKHLLLDYGVDNLYMSTLIQSRFTVDGESRFTFEEVAMWNSIELTRRTKSRCLDKINQLNAMEINKHFEINMPIPDHYYLTNLDELFFPKKSYTMITEDELSKIRLNSNTTSNAMLFAVFSLIKSYMNKTDKIAFPSIEKIVDNTTLSDKTVVKCIKILVELKLLDKINLGWDKEKKKNIGNIYTTWSEDSKKQLEMAKLKMIMNKSSPK